MAFNGWVDGVCFAKKRKVQAQRAQGMARKLTSRAKASAFREWRETTVEEKRAAMAETHGMTLCRNALARVYRKHKREAWEVWIGTAFPNQHIKILPDRPDYHDCLRILWSTVYPFQSLILWSTVYPFQSQIYASRPTDPFGVYRTRSRSKNQSHHRKPENVFDPKTNRPALVAPTVGAASLRCWAARRPRASSRRRRRAWGWAAGAAGARAVEALEDAQ